jgi:hypothetical protein
MRYRNVAGDEKKALRLASGASRRHNHLALGLMGNYAHTWTDLRPGSIDVDSARGGVRITF